MIKNTIAFTAENLKLHAKISFSNGKSVSEKTLKYVDEMLNPRPKETLQSEISNLKWEIECLKRDKEEMRAIRRQDQDFIFKLRCQYEAYKNDCEADAVTIEKLEDQCQKLEIERKDLQNDNSRCYERQKMLRKEAEELRDLAETYLDSLTKRTIQRNVLAFGFAITTVASIIFAYLYYQTV